MRLIMGEAGNGAGRKSCFIGEDSRKGFVFNYPTTEEAINELVFRVVGQTICSIVDV